MLTGSQAQGLSKGGTRVGAPRLELGMSLGEGRGL